jgi:16S rRNA (adenine1518-N6/adenine1519-N6)-dimethyltransferase
MRSGVRPKKKLAQHFLRDRTVAEKIIASMQLGAEDRVLEIGPGEGILTDLILAQNPGRLIAVELDHQLALWLKVKYEQEERIHLIEGDILRQNLEEISDGHHLRVVGNLPYNITGPLLFMLLDSARVVRDATIMVQKEVAERITSPAGCKAYGVPSVITQLYARVERVVSVPPAAFYPKPAVDSVVIRLNFTGEPLYPVNDEHFFRGLVKTAFAQRRKMLRNCLHHVLMQLPDDADVGTDLSLRPEQLALEDWVALSNNLKNLLPEESYGRR